MDREGRLRTLMENDNFMKHFNMKIIESREGYLEIRVEIVEDMLRMGFIIHTEN